MVLDFINGNLALLKLKIIIVFFTWFVVMVAIGIDLYFGIHKSKKEGVFEHSYGWRQTIKKTIYYLAFMLFMFLFDSISPLGLIHQNFNILPLASVVGCAILLRTEFISVREKSDQKYQHKIDKVAKELLELAMSDDNVLNKLKDKFKDENNG